MNNSVNFIKHLLPLSKCMLTVTLLLVSASCEDFVTVPEPGIGLNSKDVFASDQPALSAISAIYGTLAQAGSFASGELSFLAGAYTDELVSYSATEQVNDFYLNTIVTTNPFLQSTWRRCYANILSANLIVEGLQKPNGVSASLQKQLMGEALFMRAFCHFYLVNIFGDVPLIRTADYKANTQVVRTSVADVYQAIIQDLKEAAILLPDAYPSAGRVRVNKGAATALLSRAYLYADDYNNAEAEATKVIENTAQYKLLEDLNGVFLKNSEEAIWQLIPFVSRYTWEGFKLIIVAVPPSYTALQPTLYNAFETNDLRKANWTKSISSESGFSTWHYPFKYKENSVNGTGAENSMVLRLAEQYLIRAEARAQQNKLIEAQHDVNTIRQRAGLENTAAHTKEEILSAIERERRTELFTEWGHRFFDLKRTNRLDAVLGLVKPNWSSHQAWLPLPESEILINRNLTQNAGY